MPRLPPALRQRRSRFLRKRAELADAIKSARALRKTELGFVELIRRLTRGRYADNAAALADYGITLPKKYPKRTTDPSPDGNYG